MNADICVCMRFGSNASGQNGELSPYRIGTEHIKFVTCHKDLGVCVDQELKFHNHIKKIVGCCNGMMTNLLSSTLCRERELMLNLYTSLIRPKLEYGSCSLNTGYLGDLRRLERVQRRWTRMVEGLGVLSYSERLRVLDLYSVKGRLIEG